MVFNPSIFLVLDSGTLSEVSSREWLEFSRPGRVYIPQPVYEEMRMMFDRNPDPDLERLTIAFNRFYPTSGWEITEVNAHHPVLKVPTNHGMPRRARISLAVARCAYGLSLKFPGALVVMVTSDRPLIQKLQEIPSVNLCAITGQSLLQWARTGQRPVAVAQKLQEFRTTTGLNSGLLNATPTATTSRTSTTSVSTAASTRSTPRRSRAQPDLVPAESLNQGISLLLALGGLLIAGWMIWALIHHVRLNEQLWRPLNPSEQRQ